MPVQTKKPRQLPDLYLDLIVNLFPLRPIRSQQQHKLALNALRSLNGDKRQVVRDYKSVLTSIIESYERDMGFQADTSSVTTADLVKHLIENRNMSVNAFAKSVGIAQSALSDMLSGKRSWSKSVIKKLSDCFGVNPSLFFR